MDSNPRIAGDGRSSFPKQNKAQSFEGNALKGEGLLTAEEFRKTCEALERKIEEKTAELEEASRRFWKEVQDKEHAKEALRESELRYRGILEKIEEGYYEVDTAGNLVFFNESLAKMLGYHPDEMIGMNNRKYMSAETSKRVFETFNEVFRTGKPSKAFDWELIRKDGTVRYVETSVSALYDSFGQPKGFCGIARDITERKKSEMALKESEEKYRTILEGIEEGYYEVDTAGNLVFFNESLAKILGYCPDEMIGMNNRKYMSAETSKRVFETFNKVFLTGKATKAFDWELIRKDGTVRYVETSVSAVYDSLGRPKGFRGIARDITEQKFLDKAREGVINLLSHEVRTPLSIIGGVFARVGRQLQKNSVSGLESMIERGMRSLKRLHDLQVAVDDILNQRPSKETDGTLRLIESALGIVEELKEDERVGESARAALESFSRRLESVYKTEAIRWEKIDVTELVREVVQEAGSLMGGREVEIHTDVPAGLALEMDRRILKKVCGGLLRNAIENTPDEGKVEIQVVSREKFIHFSFRDYGIGIIAQNQKMIFGGFFHNRDPAMYSSKNRYQFYAGGTGVDLLRTKAFSERYKFQVGFESLRCRFLPRDEDACPGRISECSFVKDRGECFASGGSTFSLAFPKSGNIH
jgi:PAS domain S-box-containing protein